MRLKQFLAEVSSKNFHAVVSKLSLTDILGLVDVSAYDAENLMKAKERKIDEVTSTDAGDPLVIIEYYVGSARWLAHVELKEVDSRPQVSNVELVKDKHQYQR